MKTIHPFTRLIPIVPLLLLFSCVREEPMREQALPEGNVRTKVICLGDDWDRTSFLIRFAETPSEGLLSDMKLQGIRSVTPLFPSFPGKEALEREFGLDLWYEVILEDDAELEQTISETAKHSQVALVEYNIIASKASDQVVFPAQELPATRGTSARFNDPMLVDQWHYYNQGNAAYSQMIAKGADVNVNDVWTLLTCGDSDIIVAVVDEGVKYSHPDLKANMWVNTGEIAGNGIDDDGNGYVDDVYGYNFADNGPITWNVGYYDEKNRWQGDSGHGTHCAGTIAAVNNNGVGVSGVAGGSGAGDGCRIMSCQIFSGNGGGNVNTVSRAIKYAADMGASVISCSFGYSSPFASDNDYNSRTGGSATKESAELAAIHYFEKSRNNDVLDGNIAIFAAGNENQDFAHYPGAFVDIISVSAFGPDFLPTYFTNYGPGCNISAPGGEYYHGVGEKSMVLSTVPSERYGSDYGYMQGTSMACPHVSGVVALGLSYAHQRGKHFTRDAFKQMILASTQDIDQRIGKTGTKTYASSGQASFSMAPYYHQMGTGAIDAWSLMMHIEGIPCSTVTTGKQQWVSLDNLFGTASTSLTYLAVEVPEATVSALGLQKIQGSASGSYQVVPEGECYAYVQFGRLYVYPTKPGAGKLSIKAVGGGDHVGGGNNPPGGMELTEEISLIAREVEGGNGTGGWL